MRIFSKAIAVLFHPLFVVTYALLLLLLVNPYLFSFQDPKAKVVVIVLFFMLSFGFPFITIMMMKLMGFVKTLEMHNHRERIIPLAVTGAFYLWLFVNIRENSIIPPALRMFVLGATISLFLAFMINIVSKISLHTVGMGGLVMIVVLTRFLYSYEVFAITLPVVGVLTIHMNLLIIITLLLAGLVGTTRHYLKAHELRDIYGGYVVGIIGQLVAFRILG